MNFHYTCIYIYSIIDLVYNFATWILFHFFCTKSSQILRSAPCVQVPWTIWQATCSWIRARYESYFLPQFVAFYFFFATYFLLLSPSSSSLPLNTLSPLCHALTLALLSLQLPKEKPTVCLIRTHIASEPDVLHQLMSNLFNTLLLTSHANHWAVTRPILSLMLASEASFAGMFSYNIFPLILSIIFYFLTPSPSSIASSFFIVSFFLFFLLSLSLSLFLFLILFLNFSIITKQITRPSWCAHRLQRIKRSSKMSLPNWLLKSKDLLRQLIETASRRNSLFSVWTYAYFWHFEMKQKILYESFGVLFWFTSIFTISIIFCDILLCVLPQRICIYYLSCLTYGW